MNALPRERSDRDRGFTLTELLIAIVVTGVILPVIGLAIVVTLRTLPSTTARADAGVAVQGLTTWLPSDVDSTKPGGMNADPAAASGCQGTDPGRNILRLTWSESFRGAAMSYVADYRFVDTGKSAHIVRLTCSGSSTLGAPAQLRMAGLLAKTAPTVTLLDIDHDGLNDRVRLSVLTLAGPEVFIDAVSKNPGETLATIPPAASTTTTTTTTIANRAPVAAPIAITANPNVPIVINLPVSDLDGDPLTTTLTGVPGGWTTVVSGTTVTITPKTPTAIYTIGYTVRDPSGAVASSTIVVTVVTTTTTTSTSTTTSTTTTVPPPCVLSTASVSPSSVALASKGTGKLKRNVRVTISVASGYCVGLTLQYQTGAPNGQYIQNFGNSAPYVVTLVGQPNGTELWAAGPHDLVIADGTGAVLAVRTLTVTD